MDRDKVNALRQVLIFCEQSCCREDKLGSFAVPNFFPIAHKAVAELEESVTPCEFCGVATRSGSSAYCQGCIDAAMRKWLSQGCSAVPNNEIPY